MLQRLKTNSNIAQLVTYVNEADFCVLMLEYVNGPKLLSAVLKSPIYTINSVKSILVGILDGLSFCHERNIPHGVSS